MICGRWFWTKFHPNRAFSWLCLILQGLCWMKVCNNKDLGFNGHRCRLPTCLSICMLPGALPTDTGLRMKNSHWAGLPKWQGLVPKRLPCCAICPKAFAPWLFIRKFITLTWDCQQAFKVWLLKDISIRGWTMWHGQQAFKVWVLMGETSIKSWTTWHGQQAFKVWLLKDISIKSWTTWHGQQAFKVWLLVKFQSEPGQCDMASRPSKFDFWSHMISIRAWTTWHGQQAFKVWLLVGNLIRAWTTWHGQQAFKVWPFKADFNQSLDNVTWPAGLSSLTLQGEFRSESGQCDMASRPSSLIFSG